MGAMLRKIPIFFKENALRVADFVYYFLLIFEGAILKKIAISFKENTLRVNFLKVSFPIWKSIICRFWNREWATKSQNRGLHDVPKFSKNFNVFLTLKIFMGAGMILDGSDVEQNGCFLK